MARGRNLGWAASAASVAVVVSLVGTLSATGAPADATVAAGSGTPTATGTPTPEPTTPAPTPTTTPTATPTTTPSEPAPPADDLLRPDLVSVPASDLSVQTTSEGRRLRFQSALGNIGPGVIEIRPNRNQPCPPGQHNSTQIVYRDRNDNGRYNLVRDTRVTRHRAGCMVFHRFHDHWHFKASARYTLLERGEERAVVSQRRKVSFCLRDSARLPERYGTWRYPLTYGACQKWTPQGIAVGWMDIYQSYLAGQSLLLPKGLASGVYCLRTEVDPINQLTEVDDDNNTSVRAVAIRGNRAVPRPARLCR